MSDKRQTEASWDSDEDELLNDDTSGITGTDLDDDIDEDALLGIDHEEKEGDIDASSVSEAISDVNRHTKFGHEKEEQGVLDVVVNEDEEFDDTGYSNVSASTYPEIVSTNVLQKDAEPDSTQEDINQSMPHSMKHDDILEEIEHEGETFAEEEEEEEESDEEKDKDHRGRFKSERSDSVSLKPGSKARDNTPDTLEISAEEQAWIYKMTNAMDSRLNRRRRGKKGRKTPPALMNMRLGILPTHGQNKHYQHNMFGQRPHVVPHLQQGMPLQGHQQQQQQQAMRPPLIQQLLQSPPYPVRNTEQPGAALPLFRSFSTNQGQMSSAAMSIPPVLQASSTPYQGPGLLPQNRSPNQLGGHPNQGPPTFQSYSPSISDAPWNRNRKLQNPRGYKMPQNIPQPQTGPQHRFLGPQHQTTDHRAYRLQLSGL